MAEHLRSWGCEQTVDDATLLVSELVTNAVLHARAPVDVVVRKGRNAVRVEVFDEGVGSPQLGFHEIDAVQGRGLGLVQAVAARWGVNEDRDGGKTVWFEINL
jgi:anti-sigma regulatory factor (Ser/Thr protein kinase)